MENKRDVEKTTTFCKGCEYLHDYTTEIYIGEKPGYQDIKHIHCLLSGISCFNMKFCNKKKEKK